MRVATSIVHHALRDSVAAAVRAEQHGYDAVLTMENQHDPFLPLAAAAVATGHIQLGTSVALAFPRSPTVTAHAAHDLQCASGGRFVLGLGSQVKGHIERRFSVPWRAPAPWLREYIQVLRAVWACWDRGEPLAHHGEHYQITLMPPNFRPPAAPAQPVPVTIAAVGPAMLRLAGECCEGVRLHSFATRAYLDNVVLPELATGLARGRRERRAFEISGGGFLVTGADDATVARRFEFVRQRVAFYGSTRSYWPVFEQHDLLDLGERLRHMSLTDQWQAMPAEVPDDVVHLFAAVGRHDELAAAVAARFGGVVDCVQETLLPGEQPDLPADLLQDLHAIPTPCAAIGAAGSGT